MNTNTEQTYAEQCGEEPFNWTEALTKAINSAPTEEETDELLERSDDWNKCSVGNACAIIPREVFTGTPIDDELRKLGMIFTEKIGCFLWAQALVVHHQIEARSAILIAEERAKP